jgi:5'-nucleotidase
VLHTLPPSKAAMLVSSRHLRRAATLTVAASLAVLLPGPAANAVVQTHRAPQGTVSVRVLSFNDLHGNLQPPAGSSGRVALSPTATVDAGGAAYLATHVRLLQAAADHALVLSTGDNIGASPLASALFHDEPTIAALNAIGVRASVVGNHEFDEGYAELNRIQRGGCHPTDGCQFRNTFPGADFPYLGANVTRQDGRPALLPFTVQVRGGVPVGVIGVTLKDLPDVVLPSGVAGLRFGDEVRAINRTSKLLQSVGVKAQVVLLHQGDQTSPTTIGPNSCSLGVDTPAEVIARRATSRVDAVFAGHTHQAENCTVVDPAGQPRPLIQGLSFGRLVSVVDLRIDARSRDVLRDQTVAENVVVTRDVAPDPAVSAIVDRAVQESGPIADRPIGSISQDLVKGPDTLAEKPLGDVIADAQLAATRSNGAQVAITNPGGIRADLAYASSKAGEGDGVVTYGEAFAVQPFSNIMQTTTLTGAQLKQVLEEQRKDGVDDTATTWLQVSSTLHYTWTRSAAFGSRVSNLTIAGTPVDPSAGYRVSVNNFLAAGGDGFGTFTAGTDLTGGPIDLDAFTAYLTAHPNLSAPPSDRITLRS